MTAKEIQAEKYVLTAGTTFEPRDSDNNIVNARFANVLLQPDIDNAGASISLYSKINELQTYQDTYNGLLAALNTAYTYTTGSDSEFRLSYLTASQQITVPKIMMNGTGVNYILTAAASGLTINSFDGVNEKQDAILTVHDVELVDPSNGDRNRIGEYFTRLGTFGGNDSDTFISGEGIKNLELSEVQNLRYPKMTSLEYQSLETVNANNLEVVNATDAVFHLKDVTLTVDGSTMFLSTIVRQMLSSLNSGD